MNGGGILDLFDAQLIMAGCLGGLLWAWIDLENASPRQVVRYIVIGGITANFIAPQMINMIAMFPPRFIGFGVGMAAKPICIVIQKAFAKAAKAVAREE